MVRYQLAVAVSELEYARRLAEYVRDSPFGEQWQLTAFTNPASLIQFLKGGYAVDLIAAQPAMLAAASPHLPAGVPVAAFVAAKGQYAQYDAELLQYQPLPELLQSLAALHGAVRPSADRASSEGGASVIAIGSASGGVGKTALALKLANTAAKHGCRVFYLTLERWSALEVWLGAGDQRVLPEGEGMSQLLYHLKAEPDKAGAWLAQHRKRHPVLKADFILPCDNEEDRYSLLPADAAAMVELLRASRQYDLILIDLQDGMGEIELSIWRESSLVLWLVTDDPSVQRKTELAFGYAERRWKEDFQLLSRRIRLVVNRRNAPAGGDEAEERPLDMFTIKLRNGSRSIAAALPEAAEGRSSPAVVAASPLYKAAVERLFQQLVSEGGIRIANR